TVSVRSGNHLFLQDRNSNTAYLIDSGLEISDLPPTPANRTSSDHLLILATANDSPIKKYGQKFVTLDLGLRRTFRWISITADVFKSIISADFLCHLGLILDLSRKEFRVPFLPYLEKFPNCTNPVCYDKPANRSCTHSTITHRNPVKARVCRLSPSRYKIAKYEFERALGFGFNNGSSSNCSNCSSALHVFLRNKGNPFGIVFEQWNSHGLIINPSKSEIGRNTLSFLGHTLSA
ncbi:unnamed protein product, partial [Hymenolepis diminuta]